MRTTARALLFAGTGLAMLLVSTTPAFAADRNHNKIPDRWEKKYHMRLNRSQASADFDKDKLTNINEYRAGTNPRVKDSNHNGVKDGLEDRDKDGLVNIAEVKAHTNLRVADTNHNGVLDSLEDADHDGLDNREEFQVGTNPRSADTDHDGIDDGDSDADHDGVENAREFEEGTNPRHADSDHDGIPDGAEIRGTIISFDSDTGVLVVSSHRHDQEVVTTVTVDANTVLLWKTDEDENENALPPAEPTLEDLVVGGRVHDIKVTTELDGSLRATEVVLKVEEADETDGDNNDGDHEDADDQEGGVTATVVGYDVTSGTLVLQPVDLLDATYTLVVSPSTSFAWGEDIVDPDHAAAAADLVAGAIVQVEYTELDGVKTAVSVEFRASLPVHEVD